MIFLFAWWLLTRDIREANKNRKTKERHCKEWQAFYEAHYENMTTDERYAELAILSSAITKESCIMWSNEEVELILPEDDFLELIQKMSKEELACHKFDALEAVNNSIEYNISNMESTIDSILHQPCYHIRKQLVKNSMSA